MRFAILVSGRGTNMQALIDAQRAGALAPAELAVVLSNRPEVPALERAQVAGLPTLVVDHRTYPDRPTFEQAMLEALRPFAVEAIVLSGFMRVLTGHFLDAFPLRVVNTHPSLLPAFAGVDAARQALEHGVKVTGCTIHFVETGVDTGPIIAQAAVPVLPGDSPEALHQRILAEEIRLLPEVVRALAAGRLRVNGRQVRILEFGGTCP
jgi:phosphoribosylglycinamide formyltransferase-1